MHLIKNAFVCFWPATDNKHIKVLIMRVINTCVCFWWYVFSGSIPKNNLSQVS